MEREIESGHYYIVYYKSVNFSTRVPPLRVTFDNGLIFGERGLVKYQEEPRDW